MKATTMKTEFKNIVQLLTYYSDDQKCKDLLIQQRWGDKVTCPHCQSEKVYTTRLLRTHTSARAKNRMVHLRMVHLRNEISKPCRASKRGKPRGALERRY